MPPTHETRTPDCPRCKVGNMEDTGAKHQNTDGWDAETWECDTCNYTEGRNAVNPKPGNKETIL